MPFRRVTYLLPDEPRGLPARFICSKCNTAPSWHTGAANTADLPIQLRCDRCFEQCAEFLTTGHRDKEIAELHQRAVEINGPISFNAPKPRSGPGLNQ
jgi:hypothetical protein